MSTTRRSYTQFREVSFLKLMNIMTERQLSIKFEEIKHLINRNEWKYYHLQSVENFIYHLKSFSDDRTRDRMATEIDKFLELVSEKAKKNIDVYKTGKELFPYIWKISDTYKYEIGFIQKPSYFVALILLIGLFILLKYIVSIEVAITILASFSTIYVIYCVVKTRARKIW